MFGAAGNKQQMMDVLRRAQAKNLSIEKAIEFEGVNAKLDMKTQKQKAAEAKQAKVRRSGTANPKEVYEEMIEKWQKGTPEVKMAIEKLSIRATRFDKGKEQDFIKAFQTVSLDLDNFRVMLFRVFQLKFTDPEFKEVCMMFDRHKKGTIDGNEFLVCFTLLGALAKSKRADGIRKAEKTYQDTVKANDDEHRARLMAKGERKVDHDYSPEEKDRAMAKYRAAAKKYDKSHPSSMGLSGFDTKFLTPWTFREIIKLTFGISLDVKELGGLVDFVDPKRSGIINSSDFLQSFLRCGIEQRAEMVMEQIKQSKEAEEERVANAERLRLELELSKELKVDFSSTAEEKKKTMEMLHEAAIRYDPSNASSMGLDGFAVKQLKPGAFREMLKRTFYLQVDTKQLGVLVERFGDEEKKVIVSEKFILYFKRVGIKGRQKKHSEQVAKQKAEIAAREKDAAGKLAAQMKSLEVGFDPTKFTEADTIMADLKMRKVAFKFEKGGRGVPVESFNSKHMEPGVFRELCKRIFHLKLNPGELAAMVKRFDNGDGKVDCAVFMTTFGRLSTEEKNKESGIRREMSKSSSGHLKNEGAVLRMEKAKELDEKTIDKGFTTLDLESGLAKLKTSSAASLQHVAFDTKKMSPGIFKVMLKRTFNADLSPKEITAVIQPYMDLTGSVNVKLFILKFFTMHKDMKNEWRSTVLQNNRKVTMRALQEKKDKADAQKLEQLAMLQFNNETRKTLIEKLRDASFTYAVDNSSFIAPLQMMKGSALSAHTFRDLFYKTFMIRMSMPEIGVLIDLLDPKLAAEHLLSGEKFLKGFFKMARKQEKVLLGDATEASVAPLEILEEASRNDVLPAVISPDKVAKKVIKRDKDGVEKPGFLSAMCGGRNLWKEKEGK